MKNMASENFIKTIEQFAALHGMSDTGVSRFLAGSPNFLDRVRKGGDVLTHTEERMRKKMLQHTARAGVIK